jgi:hypothetical protein
MARSAPATWDIQAAVEADLRMHRPLVRVRTLERAEAAMASSYPAELITATLTDGRCLTLFLKDLSSRRYDSDLAQRRTREIAVYRDLLARAGIGTARYYGSVQDPGRNRFWLLLEHVDGDCLRYQPFEVWVHAAAWLARLHGYVAGHPEVIAACRVLRPVTLAHYCATAARATRAASGYGRGLGGRAARALADYPDLARRMAAQPRTFAHGSYRPQNILVTGAAAARGSGTAGAVPLARVCPVDWETATLAPAGYDLAYLCDGFDDERRAALVAAYRREAAHRGLPVPDHPEWEPLLHGYDLHKNLKTLAKALDRGFPADGVERLVEMVEVAASRALGNGRRHPAGSRS